MPKYHYEALTPTDYGFLVHESPKEHMHVMGLATFSSGPLGTGNGGVYFGTLKKAEKGRAKEDRSEQENRTAKIHPPEKSSLRRASHAV